MDKNRLLSSLIVKELRKNRVNQNRTQKEISEQAGISPIVYGHIETNRRELKINELDTLCKVLNLDMYSILQKCKCLMEPGEIDPSLKNKVIAFSSFKGGVGVSTLAMLASRILSARFKVLLIDADPQQTCIDQRNQETYAQQGENPYDMAYIPLENLLLHIERTVLSYDYIIIDFPFGLGEKKLCSPQGSFACSVFRLCECVFTAFSLHKRKKRIGFPFPVEGNLEQFLYVLQETKKRNPKTEFTLVPWLCTLPEGFSGWAEEIGCSVLPVPVPELEYEQALGLTNTVESFEAGKVPAEAQNFVSSFAESIAANNGQ